jgi:poly(glycerol-phosphate) alpha-glucosyltransferase
MLTGSLSRNAGGLFESVRALSKELFFLGNDLRVYGLSDEYWNRDAAAWEPIETSAFSYYGPRAMAWAPQMDASLDTAHLDLLHLHGLWQYPSIATRRQWRKKNTPYFLSPRGMLDPWALGNSRWKKIIAGYLFENSVLRNAACLHALCESEADAIRAYGLKQRIEVVPNAVQLPDLLTTEITEHTEGKKRLLFLGRIHPKKGLEGALRAWASIRNSQSAIRNSAAWQFVIAGWNQGGHEQHLQEICKNSGLKFQICNLTGEFDWNSYEADVIFAGPVYGTKKETLLRSASAFILPSFSEGLPMSVLEAWSYGLPVVMTPECNLPEGFAHGAAIPLGDPALDISDRAAMRDKAIHDGILTLMEMTECELASMGLSGRRLVEDRFTWPKVAAQMNSLYEDVLR